MRCATNRRKEIDLARVRAAVEAAELRTSAEIVVSLAPFFFGSVWAAAHRAFIRLGVAHTRRHNGVLVFVVPARRQVIVLADGATDMRIDGSVWHDVAAQMASAFANGDGTAGLIDGIDRLAHSLAGPFPHEHDDLNELPDLLQLRGVP